jgi:hypothetical protein
MNKHLSLLLFCTIVLISRTFAQSAQVQLTDLKTTNNPCFQLLDIAPSTITSPASPKDLGLALLQNLSSGSALPKNFALSVSPYWYFKSDDENLYKYLNVSTVGNKHMFSGIVRKLAISVSSTFNDSTNGSLLKNTNYYAGGIYTNIFTYRSTTNQKAIEKYAGVISDRLKANAGKDFTDSIQNTHAFKALTTAQQTAFLNSTFTDENLKKARAESIAHALAKDTIYGNDSKGLQTALNIPLLQIDAAGAYSQAFPGNSTSNSRFNRLAGWLTAALNISLSPKHADYLSFLALGKLISDNLLTDTTHNIYQRKSAHDLGGRLSYTVSSFSLGFELIYRTYPDASAYTSHRAVGFIQYKVNDNIYLTGSFGQNFGNSNNLFTLLGVNFGFGNKSASLPD